VKRTLSIRFFETTTVANVMRVMRRVDIAFGVVRYEVTFIAADTVDVSARGRFSTVGETATQRVAEMLKSELGNGKAVMTVSESRS
jgi:hypothetical protein